MTNYLNNRVVIKNLLWNLFGGVWGGILLILVTPLYIKYLGFSGYGLISLWLMMQILMSVLDLGMGASLLRQFASLDKRLSSDNKISQDTLKTLEVFYWIIGVLGALMLGLNAELLSESWLKVDGLSIKVVQYSLMLIAINLAFQFPYSLYMNGLMGIHQHKLMNILQVLGSTFRYVLGAIIVVLTSDILYFFIVQCIVSMFLTLFIRSSIWRLISENSVYVPRFNKYTVSRVWKFSLGMGITSFLAVILSNSDKLILSKMVSTSDLGMYSLAVSGSGILQLAIQPFYRVFFPRYSRLSSQDNHFRMTVEYFRSCYLLAGFLIPCCIVGIFFAPEIFNAWISDIPFEVVVAFRILLVAITLSGIAWLPAAFQQAKGWTSLHIHMMLLAIGMGTPITIFLVEQYGIVGGTAIWLIHGVIDITIGLWLMHRKLLVGYYLNWYKHVILNTLMISIVITGISYLLIPNNFGKWFTLFWALITLLSQLLIVIILFKGSSKKIIGVIKKKRFL